MLLIGIPRESLSAERREGRGMGFLSQLFGGGSSIDPLPYELKDRVNAWMQKEMMSPEDLRRRVEESSTFNALVRSEIRAGRL
jgi:hypothetical protein